MSINDTSADQTQAEDKTQDLGQTVGRILTEKEKKQRSNENKETISGTQSTFDQKIKKYEDRLNGKTEQQEAKSLENKAEAYIKDFVNNKLYKLVYKATKQEKQLNENVQKFDSDLDYLEKLREGLFDKKKEVVNKKLEYMKVSRNCRAIIESNILEINKYEGEKQQLETNLNQNLSILDLNDSERKDLVDEQATAEYKIEKLGDEIEDNFITLKGADQDISIFNADGQNYLHCAKRVSEQIRSAKRLKSQLRLKSKQDDYVVNFLRGMINMAKSAENLKKLGENMQIPQLAIDDIGKFGEDLIIPEYKGNNPAPDVYGDTSPSKVIQEYKEYIAARVNPKK